jgi:hypothetical protein
MTYNQKHTLNTLLVNLVVLIRDAKVSEEIKGKAIAIVDFYLYNPFTAKQANFFHMLHGTEFYTTSLRGYYHPTHDHCAEQAYVPLLTHMLKTNYDSLEAELERLKMLEGLSIYDDTIPTAETLRSRFVEGIALYESVDHRDYNQLTRTLPLHLFAEVTNESA